MYKKRTAQKKNFGFGKDTQSKKRYAVWKKNCEKMCTDGIWYRPNERRISTAPDQRKG